MCFRISAAINIEDPGGRSHVCYKILRVDHGLLLNFKCESRVEQELGKSGSNAAKDMTKQARQGADQGGGLDVR